MAFTPGELDTVQCLACGHRFTPRRAEVQLRRCGNCSSTGTVPEGDLALASQALRPWVYLVSGTVPPLPLPHELAAFPAALAAYARVMAQATTEEAQRRAVGLMLQRAGFSGEQVTELVQRWAGHEE
ncbi:MAG: hypothetical protein ACE5Q6_19485 [Dehalococcoidia bacterium]